jgi:hypothetical protein
MSTGMPHCKRGTMPTAVKEVVGLRRTDDGHVDFALTVRVPSGNGSLRHDSEGLDPDSRLLANDLRYWRSVVAAAFIVTYQGSGHPTFRRPRGGTRVGVVSPRLGAPDVFGY